jgi:glycine betaine/proline transport system ATP-binding protein
LIGNPVDDYVADFTRDVPKSHVLTVKSIARPLASGELPSDKSVQSTMIIREATPVVLAATGPVEVMDAGKSIGYITANDILKLIGGGAHS